jgi:copper chaperone CopZ
MAPYRFQQEVSFMRSPKVFLATLILVGLCAGMAIAAEQAAEKAKVVSSQEVAVFSIPNLMEGTTLKSLAQALGKKPGIVSAQVDAEKGTFNVTFDSKQTNPDEILKSVVAISKDAKLVSVSTADGKAPMGPGCGRCPSAKSCPKAKS